MVDTSLYLKSVGYIKDTKLFVYYNEVTNRYIIRDAYGNGKESYKSVSVLANDYQGYTPYSKAN